MPAAGELYDPKTGTFSPTGSMSTPREDHTATLLADGRVLITGGNGRRRHRRCLGRAVRPEDRHVQPDRLDGCTLAPFHTATLLADGRVLIAGGAPPAGATRPLLASAEIYDPKTGTFTPTGSMTTGRVNHTATAARRRPSPGHRAARDQRRLDLAAAELYDPTTGTFSADRHHGRRAHLPRPPPCSPTVASWSPAAAATTPT